MSLDKIQELRSAIMDLDGAISSFLKENPSPEEAGTALAELNFLKRDISLVYDGFSHALSELMGPTESLALPDGTTIEKKSSYDRKGWKHADLGAAVAERLVKMSVDMDTGEVTKSPKEIAEEMLTYCAPSYWRIKELNKIGLNADNFSEVGELKTSIIVRKPKN
jgi:hypothetical protein